MNLVVLALAASTVSPALSAPIQYGYGNLLVELKHRAYLISGIPLGFSGRIPIPLSFVVSNPFLPAVPTLPALTMPTLPLTLTLTLSITERALPIFL